MIRFMLLQNRAGKTRLAKYYVPFLDAEKRKLEYDIHRAVVSRDPKHTNLFEVCAWLGAYLRVLGTMPFDLLLLVAVGCCVSPCFQYRTYKVIYRKYAGLYFSLCIDVSDNELVLLEAIHLFVEILDHYFENVCELDLVFNFHKVHAQ